MRVIIAFQILLATTSVTLFFMIGEQSPLIGSLLMGTVGGVLYCTRAIYVNKCLKDNWNDNWREWYYLRPLASGLCGFVSCLFLKAGLLTLNASDEADTTTYGFYAIAFLAGYNVDNFLKRLEEISKVALNVKSSNLKEEQE